MIHLSKTATREVNRLRSKHPTPDQAYFRLGIQPSGCSGLSYTLGFDTAITSGDQVYSCGEISVIINAENLPYLQGLTIDYSEDLMGSGFRFHNPNASQTCGCGNSFSLNS